MARHRTLRKDIWTNKVFSKLSPLNRLYYLGLHNFADDEGKLLYDPVQLKRKVLPDEWDFSSISATETLVASGLVIKYQVRGDEYLYIPGFESTQVISRKTRSVLPSPEVRKEL